MVSFEWVFEWGLLEYGLRVLGVCRGKAVTVFDGEIFAKISMFCEGVFFSKIHVLGRVLV